MSDQIPEPGETAPMSAPDAPAAPAATYVTAPNGTLPAAAAAKPASASPRWLVPAAAVALSLVLLAMTFGTGVLVGAKIGGRAAGRDGRVPMMQAPGPAPGDAYRWGPDSRAPGNGGHGRGFRGAPPSSDATTAP